MPQESLQKLVTELDVLIRARYPLIAANTHEEGRFRRVMHAVAHLDCHRRKDKGLYLWSRTTGAIMPKEAWRHPYYWAAFIPSGAWTTLDGKEPR